MDRKPRVMITGESSACHVMSRTALDGYVMGDVEAEGGCQAKLIIC
ncbi:MAG: hypothetical protein HKM93_19600 [Desulfobacteraceae bacterium]|nr:hypothetical protein [Desulfobacteraceae bacterium]